MHSLKDMPGNETAGAGDRATLARDPPTDALVLRPEYRSRRSGVPAARASASAPMRCAAPPMRGGCFPDRGHFTSAAPPTPACASSITARCSGCRRGEVRPADALIMARSGWNASACGPDRPRVLAAEMLPAAGQGIVRWNAPPATGRRGRYLSLIAILGASLLRRRARVLGCSTATCNSAGRGIFRNRRRADVADRLGAGRSRPGTSLKWR